MRQASGLILLVCLACSVGALAVPSLEGDPFTFFHPYIRITPDERRAMEQRDIVVRVLPARDRELVVFAAGTVKATSEDLVQRVRDIARFKKSPLVLGIGRFSDPPRLEDVARLELNESDLQAIQRCRPGACKVKLGSDEMARLQRVMAGAGANWKPALRDAFRALVVKRVETYLARGHRGLPRYIDHPQHGDLVASFSLILGRTPYLQRRMPEFAAYLDRFPGSSDPAIESFLYWSEENVGPKPLISVTHVAIARGAGGEGTPDAVIAAKQVFSTHYSDASLSLTMLFAGAGGDGSSYLVYLNRSIVDGLDGMLGALKRAMVERRLRDGTEKNFAAQRERLEGR